ncbi:MAG TPA: tetratricopeptide repeat protein, partial [Guyparkeria sp.]|nr:tetratricopeptide repeat protein [Guyparkeria sp.]
MSLLEKARKQIQAGDWKAAAATCEARVRESGGDAETTYLLGLAYLNSGRAPQAAHILERLSQHMPDHADTLGALHSAWL